MRTSEDLFEEARLLCALADELEVCCDPASTAAQAGSWDCDNAAEVRGGIGGFKGAAGRAAQQIRERARVLREQAAQRQVDEVAAASGAAGRSNPEPS